MANRAVKGSTYIWLACEFQRAVATISARVTASRDTWPIRALSRVPLSNHWIKDITHDPSIQFKPDFVV